MNDQNQPQTTEARILEAAEREFLAKGFAGAKTTSIARTAGVTHAMLHYYFRTKEKLFEIIVAEKIDTLCDILLQTVGNPSLPLRERIRDGVERHFDALAANPALPRFVVNELALHPERLEAIKTKLLEGAGQVLASLQKELDQLPEVKTTALMLMADIISLNAFPFIVAPAATALSGGFFANIDELLALRKQENVKTILAKLKLD